MAHIGSLDSILESYANADTSDRLSEVSLARSCNATLVDQVVASPPRRIIKSRQPIENRSPRRNDESNKIDEFKGADDEANVGSYDQISDEEIGRTGDEYDETNGQRETSDQESCIFVEQSDVEVVSVVDSDDDSENEPASMEQGQENSDDANYNSNNSDSVEHTARFTANDSSIEISDDSIVLQKQFSRESFLKRYLTAYADKPFQCDLCKLEFRSRQNVERHKNNRVCKIVATAITSSKRKADSIDYAENTEQPLRGTIISNNHKRKTVLDGAEVQPPTKIQICKIENSKLTNRKQIDTEADVKPKLISADTSAYFGTMKSTYRSRVRPNRRTINSRIGQFIITDADAF
ncbi:hypothetical protein HA402_003989 [Bradysia odoriphaga]|nr:hypothetical protein HA402_003989 [Bradysia odoriphaga]